MKKSLKFDRGDFITQNSCPDSFAIFGGEEYPSTNGDDGVSYSLICYSNPNHYAQNSEGKWVRENIFEVDFDDTGSVCEYTLNESDFDYWRKCSAAETDAALKFLANTKRLAWEEKRFEFRKMGPNEQLCFGDPKSTGTCGGNVRHTGANPFYGRGNTRGSVPATPARKTITRVVSATWEQKIPVETMTEERRELLITQCDKLKYAFDTYGYGGGTVRVYPNNGAQVPRRVGGYDSCGYPDGIGYGMCAWEALANGGMWGCYE